LGFRSRTRQATTGRLHHQFAFLDEGYLRDGARNAAESSGRGVTLSADWSYGEQG